MNKVCEWYSPEGCLNKDEGGEVIQDECPEELEEDCFWHIIDDAHYDYNEE